MADHWLEGKAVLVTGGAGTVGAGLVREALRHGPRVVRVLDSHEHGLFLHRRALGDRDDVRWLLGDVRDEARLRRAMEGVDVVLHAAALKHVAIGEYDPFEVVRTNLVGLQNVIQAALDNDVGRVVFTSSDKAANPSNAMGASKLMGERLVAAAHQMRGGRRAVFASVRFGNVVGSSGSVAGVFRDQIRGGGPVTLTDRRMTRFVMGLGQAVRLVLDAGGRAVGGEVFVLKMPALRVGTLAEVMVRRLAPRSGPGPGRVAVVEVGPGPGEKLFEELLTETEVPRAFEDDGLIVLPGEGPPPPYLGAMRPADGAYHSGRVPPMSEAEVERFLEGAGALAPLAEDGP